MHDYVTLHHTEALRRSFESPTPQHFPKVRNMGENGTTEHHLPDDIPLFIIGGPAGCGKSTIGTAIANQFQYPFIEGDDLHPPENIAKMSAGHPLVDADRW